MKHLLLFESLMNDGDIIKTIKSTAIDGFNKLLSNPEYMGAIKSAKKIINIDKFISDLKDYSIKSIDQQFLNIKSGTGGGAFAKQTLDFIVSKFTERLNSDIKSTLITKRALRLMMPKKNEWIDSAKNVDIIFDKGPIGSIPYMIRDLFDFGIVVWHGLDEKTPYHDNAIKWSNEAEAYYINNIMNPFRDKIISIISNAIWE